MTKKYTRRKKSNKKRNNSYKNTKTGGSLGGKFVAQASDKDNSQVCKEVFNLNEGWWKEVDSSIHKITDLKYGMKVFQFTKNVLQKSWKYKDEAKLDEGIKLNCTTDNKESVDAMWANPTPDFNKILFKPLQGQQSYLFGINEKLSGELYSFFMGQRSTDKSLPTFPWSNVTRLEPPKSSKTEYGVAVELFEQDPKYKSMNPSYRRRILGADVSKKGGAYIPYVYENAIVDCLLINFDVFGLNYDNIIKVKDKNEYMRIDAGGALLFRAQGALKTQDDFNVRDIFSNFFGPNKKGKAGDMFSPLRDRNKWRDLLQTWYQKLDKLTDEVLNGIIIDGDKFISETLVTHKNTNFKEIVKSINSISE